MVMMSMVMMYSAGVDYTCEVCHYRVTSLIRNTPPAFAGVDYTCEVCPPGTFQDQTGRLVCRSAYRRVLGGGSFL